jgi:hypothetical protein
MTMCFLHAGQERDTLPCTEEPMSTLECISALFSHVNAHLRTVPYTACRAISRANSPSCCASASKRPCCTIRPRSST